MTSLTSIGREIEPEYFLNLGLNPPPTTTTRDRQIEFMSFLYGQGFSCNEIARIYGTTKGCVHMVLQTRYKKLK